jgi:hypothetical protein
MPGISQDRYRSSIHSTNLAHILMENAEYMGGDRIGKALPPLWTSEIEMFLQAVERGEMWIVSRRQ